MSDSRLDRLVSLACHDLRTPLATVTGFAKTLIRTGSLEEREAHFVDLIDAAAQQMAALIDQLSLVARIESGRYDPHLTEVGTLELARSDGDERVAAEGAGATVTTDAPAMHRALASLARAAAIHGGVPKVTWAVSGRELVLSPLGADALAVVAGRDPRDLGSLVARRLIEHLGGSLAEAGETLVVRL